MQAKSYVEVLYQTVLYIQIYKHTYIHTGYFKSAFTNFGVDSLLQNKRKVSINICMQICHRFMAYPFTLPQSFELVMWGHLRLDYWFMLQTFREKILHAHVTETFNTRLEANNVYMVFFCFFWSMETPPKFQCLLKCV